MSLRRYRPVALVLFVLHLNACSTWQPISMGPIPKKVRVTTENDRFVLNDTRLVGDTAIAGTWSGRPTGTLPSSVIVVDGLRTVRWTDALHVERRSFSPRWTYGLIAGIGIAALSVALWRLCSGPDDAFLEYC